MADKERLERLEQVKPIVIHDKKNNRDYTLEFNRESVMFAEQRGFNINDIDKYPMVMIPLLFFYAFRMHHRNISKEKTDKILFEDLGGMPDGMAERLGALYSLPYDALASDEPKNPDMTVEM